jgi:hypothetical protein
MMAHLPIEVVILPRTNLSREEASHLGGVIQDFLGESGSSEDAWSAMVRSGVADLLAGEIPKPLGLTVASSYRLLRNMMGKESTTITLRTIPHWLRRCYAPFDPQARAVIVEFDTTADRDHGEAVCSLIDALPMELIDSAFVSIVPRRTLVER